jgi:hypothetical protein
MPDEEWIKTLEDGRKVKFIYQELPEDAAFITAQLSGNEVVYSAVLTKAGMPRRTPHRDRRLTAKDLAWESDSHKSVAVTSLSRFQKPQLNRGCNLLILRIRNELREPFRNELFYELQQFSMSIA